MNIIIDGNLWDRLNKEGQKNALKIFQQINSPKYIVNAQPTNMPENFVNIGFDDPIMKEKSSAIIVEYSGPFLEQGYNLVYMSDTGNCESIFPIQGTKTTIFADLDFLLGTLRVLGRLQIH